IGNTIYQFDGNSWTPYYTMPAATARSMFKTATRLIIAQDSRLIFIPDAGTPQVANETFLIQRPRQIIEASNGQVWFADLFRGLIYFESNSAQRSVIPNGPSSITNNQMANFNGKMYVTSSSIGRAWTPIGNQNGFYISDAYNWSTRNSFSDAALANRP